MVLNAPDDTVITRQPLANAVTTELLLLRALAASKEQSDHGWQRPRRHRWFVKRAASSWMPTFGV
jgi:hypothetical protein